MISGYYTVAPAQCKELALRSCCGDCGGGAGQYGTGSSFILVRRPRGSSTFVACVIVNFAC